MEAVVVISAQSPGAGLELLRSDVRRRLFDHLSSEPTQASGGVDGAVPRRGLSAQELAEVVGLHLTTVRFHLDQMVDAGLLMTVRAAPSGGAGRPRKLYSVRSAPGQVPTDEHARRAFAALSEIMTRTAGQSARPGATLTDRNQVSLEHTPRALEQSGREWARDHVDRMVDEVKLAGPATTPGAWLGKLGVVLDLLVGWGHAPEVRTTAGAAETDILLRDCPFLALARDQPQLVCGVHRGLLRGALDALGEESVELDLAPLIDQRTCRAHLTVTTPFADRGEQR